MTVEALATRVAELEADRDALVDLARALVGTVQQLAILAGTEPSAAEPARPALRLIQGVKA